MHIHLHRHTSEYSNKREVKQFCLNHRSHQREGGRERGQYMAESPAGDDEGICLGACGNSEGACLKWIASVWSCPSSPCRSQPLIASSLSHCLRSPHLQLVLVECSEPNLEQSLLRTPFLQWLAHKRICKTHLGTPEPPEELPSF